MTINEVSSLDSMTADELRKKCRTLILSNNHWRTQIDKHKYIIRNTEMRLKKLQKEISYILEHPYGKSNENQS